MVLCGTVLCVGARPAAAGELLDAGISAFEQLHYDAALALLQRAAAAPSAPATELATAHAYLGVVYFTTGNRHRADHEFRTALVLDPSLKLPPSVSPKIVAHLQSLAGTLADPDPEPAPESAPAPDDRGGNDPDADRLLAQLAAADAPPRPPRTVLWVAGGAGAALLTTGGVLALVASGVRNQALNAHWADDARRLDRRADRFSTAAIGLLIGGGVTALGALVMYVFADPAAAAPAAAPGR